MRSYIALCAFAGRAPGGSLGDQRQDIDLLRRALGVRRQVQRRAGGRQNFAPKYAERIVHLPESAQGC